MALSVGSVIKESLGWQVAGKRFVVLLYVVLCFAVLC